MATTTIFYLLFASMLILNIESDADLNEKELKNIENKITKTFQKDIFKLKRRYGNDLGIVCTALILVLIVLIILGCCCFCINK